ncbi:MAG: hypothetical protein HYZ34_13375 [Ignavibacteriae bacterium]|nr:hypothetical protein [Ignavibacteriota bacterium]
MTPLFFHSFHIPVMGLAYTIDTPLKVARFGISSVVSIIEDNLLEEMRKFHSNQENETYIPIRKDSFDCRSRRVTAYLDLLQRIVFRQMEKIKTERFDQGTDIVKYFELLPSSSPLRNLFDQMKNMDAGVEKLLLQESLREIISAGAIDVNIMTKCDRTNYSQEGEPLPSEYSDAMAALRGFANSQLHSSVVFSAGMNPRLFTYCSTFKDFFPDEHQQLKKKITLKVSDFRSASIQGKLLAKKGLWVSEYRIESGLNCGGHAFATDGYLLAPILEEFKHKKEELTAELLEMCNHSLLQKEMKTFSHKPNVKISVQGGIGTSNEHDFLLEYFQVDSAGWGSPFLLVPEVTNVDDETLQNLISAKQEDYYLSNTSPLGVLFNNFRKSSAEQEKKKRIEKGNPGSACFNKYLSFNTEFTEKPICIASREYQILKINQLTEQQLPPDVLAKQIEKVTEKECICQYLGTAAYLKNGIPPPHKIQEVTICPGPNLAYFSNTFSLRQMIDHIYGRKNILNTLHRPNMFINELKLYVDYLEKEITDSIGSVTEKKNKYLKTFKDNLLSGIEYYKTLAQSMKRETEQYRLQFNESLSDLEQYLMNLDVPEPFVLHEEVSFV